MTSGSTRRGLRLTLAGLVTAALAYALMQTFLIPALPRLRRTSARARSGSRGP